MYYNWLLMNLSAYLITSPLLYLSLALLLPGLIIALRYAPYRALMQAPIRQHGFYIAILSLTLFWILSVKIHAGVDIHPLLMTTMVMVFGWCLAVIGGSIAQIVLILLGQADGFSYATNTLLTVLIPATISWGVVQLIRRVQFKNLFIYMLGGGFFGAMLTVFSVTIAALAVFRLIELDSMGNIEASTLPLILVLMFPEGFINGTLVTALTVFFPDLVKTFDDKKYLD